MDIDIARLAAFIDGEGYIGVIRRKLAPSHSYRYIPKIQITNSNYRLIDWLIFMFDFCPAEYTEPRHNRKTQYKAYVDNGKAIEIARAVKPFLIFKDYQAEKLIYYWENLRWQKGLRVPQDLESERNVLYEELRKLNS